MITLTYTRGDTGKTTSQEFYTRGDAIHAMRRQYGLTPGFWRQGGQRVDRITVLGDVFAMTGEPEPEKRPRANIPCAAVVRSALRRKGLGHLVEKVSSGRKRTWVRLRWDSSRKQRAADTHAVVEALRPLWNDGGSRVWSLFPGTIVIEREDWYYALPPS